MPLDFWLELWPMVVALTVEFSAEESLAGERGILLGLLFRRPFFRLLNIDQKVVGNLFFC